MLTPKQRAFIREYVIDKNCTQAAIRAGYSAATAKQQGSRLLTNVDVLAAVNAAEQKHAETCGITIETITQMLIEDRAFAKECGTPAAAVSASLGLAKLHGLVVDKQQLSGAVGGYQAVPVRVAERDPIPAVDAAARPPSAGDKQAPRH
jgi:hypothetical protein